MLRSPKRVRLDNKSSAKVVSRQRERLAEWRSAIEGARQAALGDHRAADHRGPDDDCADHHGAREDGAPRHGCPDDGQERATDHRRPRHHSGGSARERGERQRVRRNCQRLGR